VRTVWGIFKQDVKALFRSPLALIVVLAIIVLSCALAWCSTLASWDPYSRIDRLPVAIVNEDAGVSVADVEQKAKAAGIDAAQFIGKLDAKSASAKGEAAPAESSAASVESVKAEGESAPHSENAPEADGSAQPDAAEGDGSPQAENEASADDASQARSASTAADEGKAAREDTIADEGVPTAENAEPAKSAVNLGEKVADALREKGGASWQFVSAEQGRNGLATGEYYATIVLPEDFSEKLLAVLSGELERVPVEYRANERPQVVASEDSQVNAGTIDAEVGAALSASVASMMNDLLGEAAGSLYAKGDATTSTVNAGITGAEQDLKAVETGLKRSKDAVERWRASIKDSREALDSLKSSAPDLRKALEEGRKLLADARSKSHEVASAYAGAFAQGDQGVSDLLSDVSERVGKAASSVSKTQKDIDDRLAKAEKSLSECNKLIAALAKADPRNSTISDLEEQSEKLQAEVDELQKLSKALGEAAESATGVSDELAKESSDAIEKLRNRSDTFNNETLPKLDTSLDALALVMGALESALSSLDAQITQAKNLLDNLEKALQETEDASAESSDALVAVAESLKTAKSDVVTLANAKAVQEITDSAAGSQKGGGLQKSGAAQQGAQQNDKTNGFDAFMSSPIDTGIQQVYPLGSFGAGMAPLYACLALWLGCLMLVVVIKPEVTSNIFLRMRAWQGYVGRLLLFGLLSFVLGAMLVVGDVVLGVGAVSVIALVFAGLAAAFCFVNIVYALRTTFRHVGAALAVVLLVVQIPGASGAYPVQLMPEFIQAVHRWMPFTYGMGAMREAIGGFTGLVYVQDVLWLVACGLTTLALALLVRSRVLGLNNMVAGKLGQAGLFVSERLKAEVDAGENSSLARAVKRLVEDEGEQALQLMRVRRFTQRYVVVKQAAALALVALTATLCVVSYVLPLGSDEMLVALIAYTAAVLVVFAACLAFEYAYDNLSAQLAGAGVSAEDARGVRQATLGAGNLAISDLPIPAVPMPGATTSSAAALSDSEAEASLIAPVPEDWGAGGGWKASFSTNWDAGDEEDDSYDENPDDDGAVEVAATSLEVEPVRTGRHGRIVEDEALPVRSGEEPVAEDDDGSAEAALDEHDETRAADGAADPEVDDAQTGAGSAVGCDEVPEADDDVPDEVESAQTKEGADA